MRKGNPKRIASFEDLAAPGVRVIHSSPDTSGGAQWSILALYGSALRKAEAARRVSAAGSSSEGDARALAAAAAAEAEAFEMLRRIEANVVSMPESSTQAATQFVAGFGDVLITYENEALAMIESGAPVEIVVPESTIYTTWTVAKIDRNVTPQNERVVDAFIQYLHSGEAQRALARAGFRPVDPEVESEFTQYKSIADPFDISYLGGTERARAEIIDTKWRQVQLKR